MERYWYEHRDELEAGMVFDTVWGVVMLDRRVPGDGTDWYVADRSPAGQWHYEDNRIHPGDLESRLHDLEAA